MFLFLVVLMADFSSPFFLNHTRGPKQSDDCGTTAQERPASYGLRWTD